MTNPEKQLLLRMINEKWDNALSSYEIDSHGMSHTLTKHNHDFALLVNMKNAIIGSTVTADDYLREYQQTKRLEFEYSDDPDKYNYAKGC